MVHALKEELKSEGWTFVDDDEQNRTNDMNLTHTFKKLRLHWHPTNTC